MFNSTLSTPWAATAGWTTYKPWIVDALAFALALHEHLSLRTAGAANERHYVRPGIGRLW